ncbi:MAG: helix-hairpin-helix domain-containing protein [Vulcanibacillus sp.]
MYFSTKNKIIIIVVAILLISFFTYRYFQVAAPPEFDIEMDSEEIQLTTNQEEEKVIWVDVKGAVKNPSVYQMNEEDRVIHAIESAGGALENADLDRINLAEKVYDQMKIVVPLIGEQITDNYNSPTNEKVNINSASVSELTSLTGIGEAKAQAIIKYRQEKGSFSSIEDIMNVTGIAEKIFEQIKDEITI